MSTSPRSTTSGEIDFSQTVVNLASDMTLFGRFKTKRILGRGGMGVVWLAEDTKLNREVALKFMPEVVATDTASLGDLRKETRNGLLLSHPNIVRMLDLVEDGPSAAIVMEFVDGKTLNELRAEQPELVFQVSSLKPYVEQLINALEYAHTQPKMVHRDLKPHNLMINKDDQMKVADFGIASCVRDSVSRVSVKVNNTAGTLVYMSPQQLMGEVPTFSDDIYALGSTLFELLTGRPPFYAGDIPKQIETKIPPKIAQRRTEFGIEGEPVPEAWETLIAACLEKDSADRPASMAEVRKALEGQEFKRLSGGQKKVAVPGPKGPTSQVSGWENMRWVAIAAAVVVAVYGLVEVTVLEPKRKEDEERAETKRIEDARAKMAEERAEKKLKELAESVNKAKNEALQANSAKAALKILQNVDLAYNDPNSEVDDGLRRSVETQIRQYEDDAALEKDRYKEAMDKLEGLIASAEKECERKDLGAEKKSNGWMFILDNWPTDELHEDYGKRHLPLYAKVKENAASWAEAATKEGAVGVLDKRTVWMGSPIYTWRDDSRDTHMKAVKAILSSAGVLTLPSAGTTAEFDPATGQAIVAYQKKEELPVTGRLDSVTLARMNINSTVEPAPPPKPVVQKVSSGSSGGNYRREPTGFEKTMSIMGAISAFR